jgi:ubiquinone/menaquinone biosynthesis C-methylase UbiE
MRDSAAMTTIEYLDAQADSPFWQEARKATRDALRLEHGAPALDVGCGTGETTRHMAAAAGKATGIDTDAALVDEARRRTGPDYDATFEIAQAHELPFPDAAFQATRVERTLHAAEDLGQAVEELWRVTAPGGTIVTFEPDWDTLVIDVGPLAATRAVCRAIADATPNPAAGRQVARRLRKLGATGVKVEPRTAALTDLASADRQYRLAQAATATLAPAAARAWIKTLQERDEQGAFLAALTYFLVSATRPAV